MTGTDPAVALNGSPCPTRQRAEAAMAALTEVLGGLGLNLAPAKTRIVGVAGGTDGYDFLGFHHRMVPSRRYPTFRYPACWPSESDDPGPLPHPGVDRA
jgi:RNA-directed DNA polymerase